MSRLRVLERSRRCYGDVFGSRVRLTCSAHVFGFTRDQNVRIKCAERVRGVPPWRRPAAAPGRLVCETRRQT